MVSPLAHPYTGGVESHIWEVSNRLVSKGFDVEIFSTDPSGRLAKITEANGVTIRRFPSYAPNGIYHFSRRLYLSLKNVHADVIHSHDFKGFPMLAAALAKAQNRIPLVVTLHYGFTKVGRPVHAIYDFLLGKVIFQRADVIIVVSPVEMSLIDELHKVKGKIRFVPNGVDLEEISTYMSNKFKIDDHPLIRLLYVGRLEEKKGVHFLIKALQKIKQKDVELSIVGEGPFKQRLVKLVRQLELNDKVCIRGRITHSRLYELYAQSNIFVLPSEFEAHSIALTEAIAFGLVPVVTNVGGNKFMVTHGTNGFLIQYPVDINELSKALLKLIDNREMMHIMSRKAMEKARWFDIDRVVGRLQTIYRSIGD